MHCHFTFADIDEEKGDVIFFINVVDYVVQEMGPFIRVFIASYI